MKGGLMSRPKALPASTPDVGLRSPEAAVAEIEKNVSRTLRGELDAQTANSIAYQIGIALKAMEVAISDRLDKLERLATGRIRRR
jgi:hypothetical protein